MQRKKQKHSGITLSIFPHNCQGIVQLHLFLYLSLKTMKYPFLLYSIIIVLTRLARFIQKAPI